MIENLLLFQKYDPSNSKWFHLKVLILREGKFSYVGYSVRANSFRQSSEPRTSQPFLGWTRNKAGNTAEYKTDCRTREIKKNYVGRL